MREVEPEPFGRNKRSRLRGVLPDRLPQRPVQEMGRRMVPRDRVLPFDIHLQRHRIALRERTLLDMPDMQVCVVVYLRIYNIYPAVRIFNYSRVAYLTALFAVERRLRDDDHDIVALVHFISELVFLHEESHFFIALVLGLAGVFRRLGDPRDDLEIERETLPACAGTFLLRFHQRAETVHVDLQVLVDSDLLGEIDRKTERVVQQEHVLAGNNIPSGLSYLRNNRLQAVHPFIERPEEAVLFGEYESLDHLGAFRDLRERLTHRLDHRVDQQVQERRVEPEDFPVTRRAAEYLPNHIPAAFVGRHHTVGERECQRADMIGDHPKRHPLGYARGKPVFLSILFPG